TLPEGYLGRGRQFLKLEKFGAARKDFETVIELKHEPLDGDFITSLAIARIGDGKLDAGIKCLGENRPKQVVDNARDPQRKDANSKFLYTSASPHSPAV